MSNVLISGASVLQQLELLCEWFHVRIIMQFTEQNCIPHTPTKHKVSIFRLVLSSAH